MYLYKHVIDTDTVDANKTAYIFQSNKIHNRVYTFMAYKTVCRPV